MILVEKAQYNSCCFLFVKRRKITMQWFQNVKTFVFVCYCFYCLTSIFFVLFCFCETNFDVFTVFSELKRECTFHGNIYTNEKLNPFSNKICNFYVKKKKKNDNLTDYKRYISPIFLLF